MERRIRLRKEEEEAFEAFAQTCGGIPLEQMITDFRRERRKERQSETILNGRKRSSRRNVGPMTPTLRATDY